MSARRYSNDGVTASIIHLIISGAFFIAGVVFFIIMMNALNKLATALSVIFIGLAFFNLANVKAIYKDYNMSNKFVRWLLGFASVLGFLMLVGGVVFTVTNSLPSPYVKVVAFSIVIGTILKTFIQNIGEFIPAFSNPESDFLKYHSHLIFVASTLAFFSIMYIFFDFYFTLLFVGNWILVYFILSCFRSWMEEKETGFLVWAIILFVVGIGINLPIALAVNNVSGLSATLSEANLFNLASNLYFALAIVMGIGFTFLTRLGFVKSNMSDFGVEILLLVLPLLAFGLQFLAFKYFEVFLITTGAVLVLVGLIVLLFKAVVGLIMFLGTFFAEAGKTIWYIISFKWITNQIEVLSYRDKKSSSKPKMSTSCESCKYHSQISKPGVAGENINVLYCEYHNRECLGILDSNCKNFQQK